MVQEKVGSEERLNHVLLERMLVEEIIPMAEKKYQFGGCKEKRGMAGLSMGSVQTTRTICDHPDLFSEVGIFSGFIRDNIEGNPDRDAVGRKPYEQTHLKAMDDPDFNNLFHYFSDVSEIMTVSFPDFWKRMQSSRRKVSMKSGKSIRADMTGMCGDRALRTLRR